MFQETTPVRATLIDTCSLCGRRLNREGHDGDADLMNNSDNRHRTDMILSVSYLGDTNTMKSVPRVPQLSVYRKLLHWMRYLILYENLF